GLTKTRSGLASAFTGQKIDEEFYEELEDRLLLADCGLPATELLMKKVRNTVAEKGLYKPEDAQLALRDAIFDLLRPLETNMSVDLARPMVIMVVGVNGAGKTTSIGKLSNYWAEIGYSVLLAAGDTFRAAAREQLDVWAKRSQVDIISSQGADPAAVSYDAVQSGIASNKHIVIADTAGRLPTQLHLMDELKKIKKTLGKAKPDAPHQIVLVVDASNGQNALQQIKAFDDALGLTSLVVTKLDGTAKGGVIASMAMSTRVPVAYIGVGEKLEDLKPFNPREFANALVGIDAEPS
ncbi:MAG: signal recognition particle-docking protein FtsY, partial [Limnobacter sp.]|nr:signal recognition particle-docking protein FtsY [Limnobacter sp.]